MSALRRAVVAFRYNPVGRILSVEQTDVLVGIGSWIGAGFNCGGALVLESLKLKSH
jgi:hypothetical protein